MSGDTYPEGILIDMSTMENGEGITIAKHCYNAMVKCRCEKILKVLVFDNTNSNSGIHKGSATYLQSYMLEHKIIWAASRKHVLYTLG